MSSPSPLGPPNNPPPSTNNQPSSPGTEGTSPGASGSNSSQQSASSTPAIVTASWEDPTGVWQRFLSAGGTQASAKDVEMFIGTLVKFFSNVILQQNSEAAKRAYQEMQKAINGNGD